MGAGRAPAAYDGAAERARGIDELIVYPGAHHAFNLPLESPAATATARIQRSRGPCRLARDRRAAAAGVRPLSPAWPPPSGAGCRAAPAAPECPPCRPRRWRYRRSASSQRMNSTSDVGLAAPGRDSSAFLALGGENSAWLPIGTSINLQRLRPALVDLIDVGDLPRIWACCGGNATRRTAPPSLPEPDAARSARALEIVGMAAVGCDHSQVLAVGRRRDCVRHRSDSLGVRALK